ncbi:unnamed protein product [Linum trigynum]|uniref:Uncharacterized protein n=1 Tax=Linum trigynum TaxID=586398 RepID=A0AAV2DGM7_9ROSI
MAYDLLPYSDPWWRRHQSQSHIGEHHHHLVELSSCLSRGLFIISWSGSSSFSAGLEARVTTLEGQFAEVSSQLARERDTRRHYHYLVEELARVQSIKVRHPGWHPSSSRRQK